MHILYTKWKLWLSWFISISLSITKMRYVAFMNIFVRLPPKINIRGRIYLNFYIYFNLQVSIANFRIHMHFVLILEDISFLLTPILCRYLHYKWRYCASNRLCYVHSKPNFGGFDTDQRQLPSGVYHANLSITRWTYIFLNPQGVQNRKINVNN